MENSNAFKMKGMPINPQMAKSMFGAMGDKEDSVQRPSKSDFMCPTCKTPLYYPEPRVLRYENGKKVKKLGCPNCGYKDSQEFVPNVLIP
jgi:DNA-directed RNA polymerase subunit RPC12/RpoP